MMQQLLVVLLVFPLAFPLLVLPLLVLPLLVLPLLVLPLLLLLPFLD
jgi:hypothetical protein